MTSMKNRPVWYKGTEKWTSIEEPGALLHTLTRVRGVESMPLSLLYGGDLKYWEKPFRRWLENPEAYSEPCWPEYGAQPVNSVHWQGFNTARKDLFSRTLSEFRRIDAPINDGPARAVRTGPPNGWSEDMVQK